MAELKSSKCYDGESLTAELTTPAPASAVKIVVASAEKSVTLNASGSGTTWSLDASPEVLSGITGRVRWVAYMYTASGVVAFDSGAFSRCPLVSKWRAVVAAIDAAISTWATNPNQTVTCGEVSITAKSVQDLFDARDRYAAKADADERGSDIASGPRTMHTVFRR